MTGRDRAGTDAIALLEIYPSPTSRPATSTPPAQRTPCARHQRCRLLRWSTVGAADTLPDGQNAGVAGRVKRLCNWWANLFADKRRLMAPTWFGQVNRSTSTRPPAADPDRRGCNR